MDTPIRQEGYLVFQETPGGIGSWNAFHETKEEAEKAALDLLRSNIAVTIIPVVRFTTERIRKRG